MNGTRWIAIAATLMCGAGPSWAQLPGLAQQFTFERSHQNSPDIAFYGDTGVVVWSSYVDQSAGAWALTTDGGETWPVKGELPDPPIQFVPTRQPRIVVNSSGTFFAVSRIVKGAGAFQHLFLYRGDFAAGAISWTVVANIN